MKKKLTLLVAFVLVFALGVAGTFAYLTSEKTVTNTFTVGNVAITLLETAVNENGDAIPSATPVVENDYHLLPGHTYTKDPTVTVLAGSEESYVRMLVTVSDINALKAAFPAAEYADYYAANGVFLLEKLVTGWDSNVWESVGYTEKTDEETHITSATYEFRYYNTVSAANGDVKLPALFTQVVIPGSIDNAALAKLNGIKITVVAQAIQADGFVDADKNPSADVAWAAWPTK